LTEGTTMQKTFLKEDIHEIQCLAACFGIDMNNLRLDQHQKIEPHPQSLQIRSLSRHFVDAEVPNVLVIKDEEMMDDELRLSSPNVLEITYSDVSDEEDIRVDLHISPTVRTAFTDVPANGAGAVVTNIAPVSGAGAVVTNIVPANGARVIVTKEPGHELNISGDIVVNSANSASKLNNNESTFTRYEDDTPSSFVCEECERRFKKQSSLDHHNLVLHSTWICDECPKEFDNARDFGDHKIAEHPSIHYKIYCTFCSNTCTSSNELSDHLMSNHVHLPSTEDYGTTCPGCPAEGYFKTSKIVPHILKRHSTFSCKFCYKEFVSHPALFIHHHVCQNRRGQSVGNLINRAPVSLSKFFEKKKKRRKRKGGAERRKGSAAEPPERKLF